MKISVEKLEIELARQCKTLSDLRNGASSKTLLRIKNGCEVTPKTAGRIARALNVDVADLVKEEVT